ncbi:hypothetical protein [Saccharothrix coeruleofusca]|uniref:Uncharacterized protein n=1 Tax=Saccharothrix coeruleofusca TaxID=33919 RepID=A0A918AIH2_9PSEU|nr:hypothetical protein [Saccharothrix coeruleofusca]MBP2334368.1 hypothetical protein [Saccharothrix coeruleofusca]GGP41523.1 hypothetical protein GCM10010185_10910 [Saccharothrix coeruleofusca]
MEYRWRYQDEQGREVDTSGSDTFADQVDAEDWLSAHWPELRAAGVASVTLLHNESEVYGPMSLSPAD